MRYEKFLYFNFAIIALGIISLGIFYVYQPNKDKEEQFGDKFDMYKWLICSYILLFLFSFWFELVISAKSEKTSFQDISLEFNNLQTIRNEKQFKEKLNLITNGNILEVSFIYNLSKFYKLEKNIKKIQNENVNLESQKKNLSNLETLKIEKLDEKLKINDLEINKLKENIQKFNQELKNHPEDYFTGNGFITFRNFKYAHLFKNIYNKALTNHKNSDFVNVKAKKGFAKMKKAVNKLILNKNKLKQLKKPEDVKLLKKQSISTLKEKPQLKKRLSMPLFTKVSELFIFQNIKDVDKEKVDKMIEYFGKEFKIKRGCDPNTINFDFTSSRNFSLFEKLFFFLLFMIILPTISYYFNYQYYHFFTKIFIQKQKIVQEMMIEYGALIATVVVDMISLSLIQYFFDQKYFFKASSLFSYKLGFSCFYILLSNIIIPNFALKQAFQEFQVDLSVSQQKETMQFLVKSLYTNFYLLMFSGINFKLINPFLINRFILKKNKQRSDNDDIIFSLSFLVNSIFQISFYSTITPNVHLYFLFYMFVFFGIDFFLCLSNKIQHLHIPNTLTLPKSIFSNTLIILVWGIFPVAALGYYGLSKEFDNLIKINNQERNIYETISQNVAGYFSWGLGLVNLQIMKLFDPKNNLFIQMFQLMKNILSNFVFFLLTDLTFLFSVLSYAVYIFVFTHLYENERFLNRVQSRIWKNKKKIENLKFIGESFREINPAYKLMGQKYLKLQDQLMSLKNNSITFNQVLAGTLIFFKI